MSATSQHGVALSVEGRVQLSTSGVITVPKGVSGLGFNLPFLTATSIAVATCQDYVDGIWVVATTISDGSLTVYLNTYAPQDIDVAFVVLG